MTPVKEKEVWTKQIEQMDVGDKVLGGDDGPINQPLKGITNRTAFLKAMLTVVINKAGLQIGQFDDVGLLASAIEKIIGAGSVDEAGKLKTSRLVGGLAFNGTKDIHLPISADYAATERYESGDLVKVDGIYYECYHPDGVRGKDPRDPKNRPEGWQNADTSQPYYWLKIGKWLSFPETGSPIYLPTTSIREGLIKYRNDGNLHKHKFWRLAGLYPELINNNVINIADLRAEFLRGLDDGRGVDAGRVIGSFQNDMLAAHNHSLGLYKSVNAGIGDEIKGGAELSAVGIGGEIWGGPSGGNETRPRNVAMLIATRI